MLKLKNFKSVEVNSSRPCGGFDGNCILCDGGWWDFNV